MRSGLRQLALAGLLLTLFTPVLADDVSGAERLLCAAVQAAVCSPEGECETGPPWNWNIPQFIEVDLQAKRLGTTEASGEDRSTPLKNVQRDAENIYLQGIERGRAFSFAIHEKTGKLSAAVARDGITVSVFGACTTLSP